MSFEVVVETESGGRVVMTFPTEADCRQWIHDSVKQGYVVKNGAGGTNSVPYTAYPISAVKEFRVKQL
jgi:hypothetical protein